MKRFFFNIGAILLIVCLPSLEANELNTQALENQLKLRDQTIIELTERLEILEKRVGLPHKNIVKKQEAATEKYESDDAAPGRVIVEEGDAERALERSLTLEGALLLPKGVLELEPGFYAARRESSIPGFFTQNNQTYASKVNVNNSVFSTNLSLRLGLPWDSQFELGVPYYFVETQTSTSINFTPVKSTRVRDKMMGDINVGLAKTLMREGLWRPDLVARFSWDGDNGESDRFQELRASFTAIKRQDPVTLIGGLGYQYTREKNHLQPGSLISASFGSLVALSPNTSMRFLFSGSYQNSIKNRGSELPGTERVIGSFLVGGSILVARGTLLNLAVNIGLTEDADELTLTASLPIRLDNRVF